MDIWEAMEQRHSVRSYSEKEISFELTEALQAEIDACNRESGLDIRLIRDEERAFSSFLARCGKFHGVKNYLVLMGKDEADTAEKVGYFGERLVLKMQILGLNSCWVAATYGKGTVKKLCPAGGGEKLFCVIAFGYGATQGRPHASKAPETVCPMSAEAPEWFKRGAQAALLAPTALNRQDFKIELRGGKISIERESGKSADVSLGIVKYHFELGAGKENFEWE